MFEESMYEDMNNLHSQNVSVESVEILRSEGTGSEMNEETAEECDRFLKLKLNLELFKIPIKYLKWYLDSSL